MWVCDNPFWNLSTSQNEGHGWWYGSVLFLLVMWSKRELVSIGVWSWVSHGHLIWEIFWRGFKFLFIRYEVHCYYSFVLMVLLIEIQVRRLCKCVFKSTQMWRMVLVMKAFLLDGKNQRDRPDAFFCPLPELISQKTTPVSIVFYYALNLASCFFWYGAATGNFFFFFFLGKARNRFF